MSMTQSSRFFISDIQELNWKAAFAKLEGLFQLEDDWDGEDASKPDPELITAAIRWLTDHKHSNVQSDSPPSRILASPDGEVVFQWITPSSREQIEFLSAFRAEWSLIGDDFETQHEVIDFTDDRTAEKITISNDFQNRTAEKITISNDFQNDINCEEAELYSNPKIPDEITWSAANSYPI